MLFRALFRNILFHDEEQSALIRKRIEEQLFNPKFNIEDNYIKNQLVEQYKVFIDSAHRIEEARKTSNNVYVGINAININCIILLLGKIKQISLVKVTVASSTLELEKMSMILLLLLLGIIISWTWHKTINSYKLINFVNYACIEALEEYFPARLFTIRADISSPHTQSSEKANVILKKEILFPVLFLIAYFICFIMLFSTFL